MVDSKKWFRMKVMTGAVVVLGIYAGIRLSGTKEDYQDKKIIVCLDKGGESVEEYSVDSILVIHNIQKYYDYDSEKKTCLYSDYDGKIIEKDIMTNLSKEINFENIEEYTDKKQGEFISNLKYMPGGQKVSFVLDDCFYVYDYEKEKVITRRECLPEFWVEYQWQDSGKLYVIPYDDKWIRNLYMYENLQAAPVYIAKGIKSIVPGNDGEKIYGILDTVESYYGSGFEMKHEIVEIDVKTGENQLLQELDSENFILEGVNDEFLFYVEKLHNKKRSKVYCLNLKNGQKNCIYKTHDAVIGIIIR